MALTIISSFFKASLGVAALLWGASLLVRGGGSIALKLGISPLVVGILVLAFGTSSPELFISAHSTLSNQDGIAIGNVIGSNIFNILFILGACAVVRPVEISLELVRIDIPLMITCSVLMFALSSDGSISRVDGILLLSALVLYAVFRINLARSQKVGDVLAENEIRHEEQKSWWSLWSFVLVGLVVLVFGAEVFVNVATDVGRALGVSELVIGITIVSVGTSLPEIATSLIATFHGKEELAVGNAIGSNIFNILVVLGVSALLVPITVPPGAIAFDIPVLLAVSIASYPCFISHGQITRWEGLLFLLYYVAYIAYLVMYATDSVLMPIYEGVMLLFVIPLTLLSIGLLVYYDLKKKKT